MRTRAASATSLILCLACERASLLSADGAAPSDSSSQGARAAPPAPPSLPIAQTQQSPAEETRWIAYRWARQLPSFQLAEEMCPIFEQTTESHQLPVDAWGTPFRVRCDRPTAKYVFTSAGADRNFETTDDILVVRSSDLISGYTGKH